MRKRVKQPSLLGRSIVSAVAAVAGGMVVFAPTMSAALEPVEVPVVAYDIAATPRPGWGCWTHMYDGTVTDTGRTVSGSVVCPQGAFVPAELLDYTNGSGTLNDGNLLAGHLLVLRPDDAGTTINPQVTVQFATPVHVETIIIHGGDSVFAGGVERHASASAPPPRCSRPPRSVTLAQEACRATTSSISSEPTSAT